MLMSRLCTAHTHGNVKVEQYSAEAESAIYLLENIARITNADQCHSLLSVLTN